MTEWAGQAAQRTLEQKRLQDQNTERINRVNQIKAEAGPRLFKQLVAWANTEIPIYNDNLGHGGDAADELTVTVTQSAKPNPALLDDLIVIARRDGKKEPLKIWYSAIRGVLSVECAGRREEFTLCVGDDDQPFFKNMYNQPKKVEEIGADALNKFIAAKH